MSQACPVLYLSASRCVIAWGLSNSTDVSRWLAIYIDVGDRISRKGNESNIPNWIWKVDKERRYGDVSECRWCNTSINMAGGNRWERGVRQWTTGESCEVRSWSRKKRCPEQTSKSQAFSTQLAKSISRPSISAATLLTMVITATFQSTFEQSSESGISDIQFVKAMFPVRIHRKHL